MNTELRVYPLPYVDFCLNSDHLLYINEKTNMLFHENPELKHNQLNGIKDRMAACMAFAEIYGKQDQFLDRPTEEFKWPSFTDFRHGPQSIKIVPGRVNEKMEKTGVTTEFRVPSNIIRQSKATHYVMAAFHMPHVQLIGWMEPAEMKSFIKGWSCTVFAGCPKIKCMKDLSVEEYRVNGVFV